VANLSDILQTNFYPNRTTSAKVMHKDMFFEPSVYSP